MTLATRSDWEIYKGLAKKFSELCPGHLDKEKDVVASPILQYCEGSF
jgi:nitrate reductase alpha subunit